MSDFGSCARAGDQEGGVYGWGVAALPSPAGFPCQRGGLCTNGYA